MKGACSAGMCFFSSRRRHTRCLSDWSSDVCSSDLIGVLIGMIVLAAFAGSGIGLVIGTVVKPEQISLMFSVILTPLLFTGCTYYPWSALGNIRCFQIITLFNPLTYAAERS